MDAVATTPAVGTSLEVLAPYLPYGIEIEIITGNFKGQRREVQGYDPRSQRAIICRNEQVNAWGALPVLRPFSALPDVQVETPWGQTPASVALVRRLTNMQVMPENVRAHPGSLWAQDYLNGPFKSVVYAETIERGNLLLPVADFLRRHHFAVGLKPHQYVVKTP